MPGISDDTLAFDREWAFALIARGLATLEREHSHRLALFSALKPWLNGAADTPQSEIARSLGMSETAVKVAIHRLRERFRELIRAEISSTLDDPADIADELRYLITAAAKE
jgi:RNA polymerase sigma-70 factor (ECF subfamily)